MPARIRLFLLVLLVLLGLALAACAGAGQAPAADGGATEGMPWPDGLPPGEGAPIPESGLPDLALHDGALPTDGTVPQSDGPQLQDNTLPGWTWFNKGSAATDRQTLAAEFAKVGYSPPSGTYLLAARVLKDPGLGQPAFQYFSLGDTGLTFSSGQYWPASTVKLTAAVGALWTLGKYGLSGAAWVSFTDDDGAYSGSVKNLYDKAIIDSDNVAYNRLMEIAGFDEMNDQYLVAAHSLPKMVLQRRYTHPYPTSNLLTSPPIDYAEGSKTGQIPKRVGTGVHPSCPNEGNCITLFELMDVLRRVTLDGELPAGQRFPLQAVDVGQLKAALLAAPSDMEPGLSQALGHAVQVYNKSGEVWTDDRLDHGLVVDTVTGERFLLGWSMPYGSTSAAAASELSRQTLLALKKGTAKGPVLQEDAGVKILVNLKDNGPGTAPNSRSYTITVAAPGADAVELWADWWPLPPPAGPSPFFTLTYEFSGFGDRLLVVRATNQNKLTGFRAATVHINGP
jgi:hypothetical protein